MYGSSDRGLRGTSISAVPQDVQRCASPGWGYHSSNSPASTGLRACRTCLGILGVRPQHLGIRPGISPDPKPGYVGVHSRDRDYTTTDTFGSPDGPAPHLLPIHRFSLWRTRAERHNVG